MTKIECLYSNLKNLIQKQIRLVENYTNIENTMKLQIIHNPNTQKKKTFLFLEVIFMD